jgi:Icc-related predicted phosphoesterase
VTSCQLHSSPRRAEAISGARSIASMRILLVADLHYTLKQLDWVVGCAAEYDLVVVAGDLLDIRSPVEPDAQIVVVLGYLERIAAKTTVVACSGNHDLNARNELGERAALWLDDARALGVLVDGDRVVTDDVFVTVCPWWDGPRTRDEVDGALAADAAAVNGRLWIWAYHAPPDASPTSWTGRKYYGDTDLNAWIDRHHPGLVLCGHVHESPFAEGGAWADQIGTTLVVNSGRDPDWIPRPVPAHIVVDTSARTASWMSSKGIDERSFATT